MDDFRVQELERELRNAQRTISRIQGAMRTAARYEASPSPDEPEILVLKRQLAGMQAALLKGAEEAFRPNGRKSRNA